MGAAEHHLPPRESSANIFVAVTSASLTVFDLVSLWCALQWDYAIGLHHSDLPQSYKDATSMEIWEETLKIERLFDAGGLPGSEVSRPFPALPPRTDTDGTVLVADLDGADVVSA